MDLRLNAHRFTEGKNIDTYEKNRPIPSLEIIHHALNCFSSRKVRAVVDLGSGTGVPSLLWNEFASEVIGVNQILSSKQMIYLGIFLWSLCFFCSHILFSQSPDYQTLLEYDKLVGPENTDLYNGEGFKDRLVNRYSKNHRYFGSFDFEESSIIYDEQKYVNVFLKYDLYRDNVILKPYKDFGAFEIKLIPEKIASYTIGEHRFVKLLDIDLKEKGNGFFEELHLDGNYALYAKHMKINTGTTVKSINGTTVKSIEHFDFKQKTVYVLFHKGNYHRIQSIKSLKTVFPAQAEQISDFYSIHRRLYKSDPGDFMVKILKTVIAFQEKTIQ